MRLGGAKTIVSWKQKLALRLMGITHDINKLSQDFIRAKSINNPSTDFHAVQIMESRFLNKRFWETTGNIPSFVLTYPLLYHCGIWFSAIILRTMMNF